MLSEDARLGMLHAPGAVIFAAIAGIMIMLIMICIPYTSRKVPINYIMLTTFTLCEAYMVAFICAAVDNRVAVLAAAFCTAGIVVALTMYAMFTKTDFTYFGGFCVILAASMALFLTFSIIFGFKPHFVYCMFGTILFGIYLIIDTQMIIGGKRHTHISKEDYILAATILYLDILNIFLYLLRLFGDR